jgi:hypothetical protein
MINRVYLGFEIVNDNSHISFTKVGNKEGERMLDEEFYTIFIALVYIMNHLPERIRFDKGVYFWNKRNFIILGDRFEYYHSGVVAPSSSVPVPGEQLRLEFNKFFG